MAESDQENPSEGNQQGISKFLTSKQIVVLLFVLLLLGTSIVLSVTLIKPNTVTNLTTTTIDTNLTTTTIEATTPTTTT